MSDVGLRGGAGVAAPPTSLRPFPVVAGLRVVVTAAVQVGTVVALPRLVGRTQAQVDRRVSTAVGVPVHSSTAPALLGGIAGGLVGLVWLVGWAVLAWQAYRGVRWGAVGAGVLSGTAVLGGLVVTPLSLLVLDYPGWLLGLVGVGVVLDLAVVVLLTRPDTRGWLAVDRRPAGPPGPPGPPPLLPGPRH